MTSPTTLPRESRLTPEARAALAIILVSAIAVVAFVGALTWAQASANTAKLECMKINLSREASAIVLMCGRI